MKPMTLKSLAWLSRGLFAALFLVALTLTARPEVRTDTPVWDTALTVILMAIPLVFLFLALGLLAEVVGQELLTHHLTRRAGTALRWLPRMGGLLFAAFISLFALDVFGQGYSFWETLTGLFMHLLPTIMLVVVLLLAWRWSWAGGIGYLALAALFVIQFGGGWGSDWTLYLMLVGPLVAIGLLFLANWQLREELRHNGAVAAGPA